jgi:hypothetical protein
VPVADKVSHDPKPGSFKQRAFNKLDHGVYCSHLDLGFEKTFDGVMWAFAETFEAPRIGDAP